MLQEQNERLRQKITFADICIQFCLVIQCNQTTHKRTLSHMYVKLLLLHYYRPQDWYLSICHLTYYSWGAERQSTC